MEQAINVNRILASLSAEELARLSPDFEQVTLPVNQSLFRYGDAVESIFFPCTAVISLVCLLEGGRGVEIGLVGREGLVGLQTVLGPHNATYAAEVLVPGRAMMVRAGALRRHYMLHDPLYQQLLLHSGALLTQFSRLAVCNLCHHIPERVCRWLLMLQDRAAADEFHLTHEQIAEKLGIRRSGVTVQLGQLEAAGAIQVSRGRIKILDRRKLEGLTCECYRYLGAEAGLADVLPSALKGNAEAPSPHWPRQIDRAVAASATERVLTNGARATAAVGA